jgi:hypothetical protein
VAEKRVADSSTSFNQEEMGHACDQGRIGTRGFTPLRRTIASMQISNISDLASISDYRVEAAEGSNPIDRRAILQKQLHRA